MDKMSFDDLFDMVYELGYQNIEGWCLQLVADEYKKFTDSEWKLFFYIIDDSVKIRNFVNEVIDDDPAVLMHVLKQVGKESRKMKDDTAHYWTIVKKYIHKQRNQGVALERIYLPEDYYVGLEDKKHGGGDDEDIERELDKIQDETEVDPLTVHYDDDFGEKERIKKRRETWNPQQEMDDLLDEVNRTMHPERYPTKEQEEARQAELEREAKAHSHPNR